MPHKTWQIYLWTTFESFKNLLFLQFPVSGIQFQSKLAPIYCCPTSRKWTPEATLNKKSRECSVVLYPVKKQATRHVWNSRFSCEVYLCALTNKAQLIFLYNVVSDVFGQHWLDNILMQCCPRYNLSIQHPIGYFPYKSCLLTMDQYCTGNFLMQCCEPDRSIFLCKVVSGLWANIAQVILLCNECWLRQI